MPAATARSMTEPQFLALRKIIYDRSGIHFPDAKKYVLESRLANRLIELEMDSFDEYVAFLSMGPYQSDEFQEMFNRITINETSFFRNEPQLSFFEKTVLPELLERREGVKRLRLWSAPCSTGEEPYTLAIILHRSMGVRLMDWRIEILGTDISEKCLEAAAQAKYTEYSMRSVPPLVRQRYFKQDGPYWALDPTIKQMVSFDLHNLKDSLAARRRGTWDAILCRNCLIYFDDAMKQQVLATFAQTLAADGTLLIGHSETIRPGEAPFSSVDVPHAFAYRRVKAAA
ncbi:MAG: protein-glutamate O-methyltransferase CheR [Phycisphaerae bacterium]|nr:protein-glutamate O-methyltransferase CheR [Phycisphaerae bacterium]